MWVHISRFKHLQFKWFCFCLSLLQAWPPKALPYPDVSFITLPLHSFPQPNPSWPHPHRPPVYPGGLFHFPFPGKSICPHPNFRPSFFNLNSLRLLVVAWISFSLQPTEILFEWKIMKNIVKLKRSLDCVTYRNILGDLTKRKFEPREVHTVRNMWRSTGEESYWSDGIHWEVPKIVELQNMDKITKIFFLRAFKGIMALPFFNISDLWDNTSVYLIHNFGDFVTALWIYIFWSNL